MKPIIKLPADYYLSLINDNTPFSFSRFGDGEVLCMHLDIMPFQMNVDGSKFLPEIIKPMKDIFVNQFPYYHCLLDCSFDFHGNKFKKFIEKTCPNMDFYDGEVWQHLSFTGRITELMKAINKHNFCLVGGGHLEPICEMHGLDEMIFIKIPSVDSFLWIDEIQNVILQQYEAGCDFFGFCAGYTTKVLIDRLFQVIGHKAYLIDFGSVFDPYCGRMSRDGMKYYGKEKFQPFTRLEL